MALIITTNNPQRIKDDFERLVGEKRILTWVVDADGDFTIPKEQWYLHAWMRPAIINDNHLAFRFISSTRYPVTRGLYGIYHGRLAATLLAHFDTEMDDLQITPLMDRDLDV